MANTTISSLLIPAQPTPQRKEQQPQVQQQEKPPEQRQAPRQEHSRHVDITA